MNPKISIITITFNSEKTLEDTILSVVNQDYDNLEYLIIDGGSKDNTLQVIEKYKEKIAVVISEPDKGISDAFNKGVKLASGDIIGLINSDDILCEDALLTVANSFSPEIDVYRGRTIIWNEQTGAKISCYPSMSFPLYKDIKAVNHQSTFITKNAYEKYGLYRVDFHYMMDADILYRMYFGGAKFISIDKDLAIFRLGGTTSDNWKNKIHERKKMVIENGGSQALAVFVILRMSIKSILKEILYSLFDEDQIKSIWYSK